ncbi:MAG: hypothetical protein GXO66_09715 [Euryarchaeota archaeon]|nr:hypothetical protein [Euryarchaeota archaeon]
MRHLPLLLLLLLSLPAAFPATVCPTGCDYSSLQEAVSSAAEGEVILVKGGSYSVNLVINRSLTVVGEGGVLLTPGDSRLPVVYVVSSANVTLRGLGIDGAGQSCVEVELSRGVRLEELELRSCLYGLRVSDSSRLEAGALTVEGASFGVEVQNTTGVRLEGLTLRSPTVAGVILSGSSGCYLGKSSILPAGAAGGLYLQNSDSCTISEVLVSGGGTAVSLDGSSGNTLRGIRIADSSTGFELSGSRDNTITGSSVSSAGVAVYLKNSRGNLLYGNDFTSGGPQAVVDDNPNLWNSSTGNYWRDYGGRDADGDGFGDVPYVINSLNVDHLPVVRPFFALATSSPPPPAGGGAGKRRDPLAAGEFFRLDEELLLSILDYFDVRGRVYSVSPAAGAALLAIRDRSLFPVTGAGEVDSRLGAPAEWSGGDYSLVVEEVGSSFTFSEDVVVARGDIGADAVSAIAYARARRIPLLLVEPGRTPAEVRGLIERLGVRRVVIVGGPRAVSPAVERELASLAEVVRIYGETRVETSIRMAQALEGVRGTPRLLLVQDGWRTSPGAAILSALYEAPVLYVRGDELPPSLEEYLKELSGRGVAVVFAGVSPPVESAVREILKGQRSPTP